MLRFAALGLCLMASPVLAGDQSLYPHTHTNSPIVGSKTIPINYRAHKTGNGLQQGFDESEIIRHANNNPADDKFIPWVFKGAGSDKDAAPVIELFTQNIPALRGQGQNGILVIEGSIPGS